MSNINSFSRLLSIGTICLLIGGTIAAKTVFIVDNDLESQAKLNPANWRLDANSARKYTEDIEKFSRPYLERFSQFSQQSSWCESAREISLVLAEANLLDWVPQSGKVPESWCIQPKVKK
jgi:hypothetical protein